MRDVEHDDAVKERKRERERKYDGIILAKRTRTRARKREKEESQGSEHRTQAREFGKNGAALTFMKMKL